MKEIKSVSHEDYGRVARTKDGEYHVRLISIRRVEGGFVECDVEDLDNPGYNMTNFMFIGGVYPLYWVEDPIKHVDYPEMVLDISTAVHASRHVKQPRNVMDVMAYLTAETGECADWLVNPDRRKEDLLGECADVIICALDLALVYKKKTSDLDGQELADEVIGQLNELLKLKAEKWMDKHAKL